MHGINKHKHAFIYIHIQTKIHEKSKIPFSYMLYAYSVKKPIGEQNLKRALDEDKGVYSLFPFSHFFVLFSTGLG